MQSFYIASSFQNVNKVHEIFKELKKNGYLETYDWTKNNRTSSVESLRLIGEEERAAVLSADFLIVLLPAGKGSHVELGIALGAEKKVFLYAPSIEVTSLDSTFYYLPEVTHVTGSIDELLMKITMQLNEG